MIGAPIAKPFDAGFDGAQPISFVRVRFEGVADDVGAVQLHAGLMRRAAKLGAVVGMVERRRHARQDGSAGIGVGIG